MTTDEKQKFAINEAKDLLKDTTSAISKTRDKSWQLLAFLIAIDVYLIKCFLENTNTIQITIVSIIATGFSVAILYYLNGSIFPVGFMQNGGHPEKLKKIIKPENDDIYFDVIMQTYQNNIDKNDILLTKMVENYKKALTLLYWLIGISLSIFFLFVFIKGCEGLTVH